MWLVAAKAIAYVFNLALPLLVVRVLSQADFGHYKQSFLVIVTAVSALPLGFNYTASYFLPREKTRQPQVIFHLLLIGICAGLIATFGSLLYPHALTILFREPALEGLAMWIGLIVPLWIMGGLLEVIPVAIDEIRPATAFIVTSQMTRTVLLFGAAALFASVRALLVAAFLQGIVQCAVLIVYLHKLFPGFSRGIDAGLLKAQLAYGFPLGMASLLYLAQTDLHNYFVSNRLGAEAFAVYSIGCLNLPIITLVAEAANGVMLPRVATLSQEDKCGEILTLLARGMRKLSLLYFPVYAVLLITGPQFIEFLFTRRYAASWPIFAINLTLIPASVLFTDPVIRAYPQHMKVLLRTRIILLIVLVPGLWYAISSFGPVGAVSVAVALGLMERVFCAWYFVGRVLSFQRSSWSLFGGTARVAFATAGSALITIPLHQAMSGMAPLVILLACGSFFVAVYIAALFALKVPEKEEIAYARGWLKSRLAAVGVAAG